MPEGGRVGAVGRNGLKLVPSPALAQPLTYQRGRELGRSKSQEHPPRAPCPPLPPRAAGSPWRPPRTARRPAGRSRSVGGREERKGRRGVGQEQGIDSAATTTSDAPEQGACERACMSMTSSASFMLPGCLSRDATGGRGAAVLAGGCELDACGGGAKSRERGAEHEAASAAVGRQNSWMAGREGSAAGHTLAASRASWMAARRLSEQARTHPRLQASRIGCLAR